MNIGGKSHSLASVEGAPLTISNQEITFNYDSAHFGLSGNDLQIDSTLKTNWDAAYTHSQDNSQAHSDYMLNTGDTASGNYNFDSNTFVINSTDHQVEMAGASTGEICIEFTNPNEADQPAFISAYTHATAGTYITLGSNLYTNAGSLTRSDATEESCGIMLKGSGVIDFSTGTSAAVAVSRMTIAADGDVDVVGDLTAGTVGSDAELILAETTTPAAVANYGKVYTKNDNTLYFQDGAGSEHAITTTGGFSKARAYLSAEQQNLTDSTDTKVALDTESFDIGSDFDAANSKYVAPQDGKYLVVAKITFNGTVADKPYVAKIFVNGAEYSRYLRVFATADNQDVSIIDMVDLSANDEVELYANQQSGGNLVDITGGERFTMMAISLLP